MIHEPSRAFDRDVVDGEGSPDECGHLWAVGTCPRRGEVAGYESEE